MTAAIEQFDLPAAPLDAGVSLIEASAGTGKTYNIAGLFVRLLLEGELEARQILTVTFTDAATKELRDRIGRRLAEALTTLESGKSDDEFMDSLLAKTNSGELDTAASKMRLRLALAEFDTAPIYTIHSFCQRILTDRAFECGRPFQTELTPDETELRQRVARDFWRAEVVPNELAATVLLGMDLSLRNEGGKDKTGPEALLGLLRPCLNHPRLEVLGPETGEAGTRESLEENLANLAQCWKHHGGELEAWLNDPDANLLSQSKELKIGYKVETIVPMLLESMRAIISGEFSPRQFTNLEKFTWPMLEKKAQKKYERPTGGIAVVVEHCESVWAAGEAYRQSLRAEFIKHAQLRLHELKSAEGVMGYGDLITELADALRAEGGNALREQIRGQFAAALIDEFQDTDPLQCKIFLDIFKDSDTALFLIGDPKQSIYRFRGADVFSYLSAKQFAQREATLCTNWRSEPELIAAVNAVFQNRPDDPLFYEDIRFEDAQAPMPYERAQLVNHDLAPLQLWSWPGTDKGAKPDNPPHEGEARVPKQIADRHLPEVMATAIVKLLESDQTIEPREKPNLQPRDIAVLVKTNKQANAMKAALSRRGVPAVLNTTDSVFDSPEAGELERVLEAVATPNHTAALKLALATDIIGRDAEELFKLVEEESALGDLAQTFADYRDRMERNGFLAMFRKLLDEQQVRASLLRFEDGERRLTNLFHLGELLHETATEQRLNPAALARWLAQQRQDGRPNDANQLRLESDEDAVKLVTIHRSKGLEYPIVFLPYTWDRRNTEKQGFVFHPDPRDNPGHLQLDLGSDELAENRVKAAEENLADELRLLYVALTRARHRCYVVTGCIGGTQGKSLREITGLGWLLHPALMQQVDPDNSKAGVQQLTGESLLADCEILAAKCPHIETSILPEARPDKWTGDGAAQDHPLQARKFTGKIQPAWGAQSYSTLAHATLARGDAEERRDHDARPIPIDSTTQPSGIHALPAGARTGTCLHEIFETIDYPQAAAADPEAKQTVASILSQHSLEDHLNTVWPNVQHILNAPLDESIPGFTLGKLKQPDRLMELEFTFNMAGVTAPRLAEIFHAHGGPALDPNFPSRLGRLQFQARDGFMRGFIDLLFRHEDRYYILDWKSNRLGPDDAAYTPERLRGVMTTEFYTLQYHVYILALHLYLGQRLPNYDFDRHIGGAFYIFTRGIESETRGTVFDQPQRALVETLAAEFKLGPQST